MQEVILASNNSHKLKEIQEVLSTFNLITLRNLGFEDDIPETAETFQGNALIKAETIYNIYKRPVISDDSGLIVPALNNKPGVYSSRYAGHDANDIENYTKLLLDLSNSKDRRAYFRTIICYYNSPSDVKYFTGELHGQIGHRPIGSNGFGYDPIFIPNNQNKSLAQYLSEEKNAISHRAVALEKFKESLN